MRKTHVNPRKERRFIQFYTELVDEFDNTKLVLTSNSAMEANDLILSEDARGVSDPFYIELKESSGNEVYMGLTIEQAEELAQELMTAVNFLRE
jgi:hypothetical protein